MRQLPTLPCSPSSAAAERHRLERNRTQAEMAVQAGIGRATVQRVERGESVQMTSMVKLLRTLGLLARSTPPFPSRSTSRSRSWSASAQAAGAAAARRRPAAPGRSDTSSLDVGRRAEAEGVTVAAVTLWGVASPRSRSIRALATQPSSTTPPSRAAASRWRRSGCRCATALQLPGPAADVFSGLPGLLADSLPDRWGTALVDAWLASQGRDRSSFDVVQRLCYVGTRGMARSSSSPLTSRRRPGAGSAGRRARAVGRRGARTARRVRGRAQRAPRRGGDEGDPRGRQLRRRRASEGVHRLQRGDRPGPLRAGRGRAGLRIGC